MLIYIDARLSPDQGPDPASSEISCHATAADALKPMGWTSENVAGDYSISREDMDAFAAASFQRAERAQKEGRFDAEIVPFTAYVTAPTTGARTAKVITKDDGIRFGTTKESLLKIRSAFPQWAPSYTTGGNASQITDGAAAVLLMRRSKADELGVKVIGKHVTTAVTGVPPRIMGVGPLYAIPMALEMAGLTKDEVDLYEVRSGILASGRLVPDNVVDQRGVRVAICVLRETTWSRQGEGEREWRSNRSGSSIR